MSRRFLPQIRGHQPQDVVPRALAERIVAERDAVLSQFERARQENQLLRRRLAAREEEGRQLVQAVRALEARGAASQSVARDERAQQREAIAQREARTLSVQLEELKASLEVSHRQLQAAWDERDALSAERDAAAAALGRAEAQLDELKQEVPDQSRVQRLAADLANVRRREKETIEAGIRNEKSRLLAAMAGVRDSLQRAVAMSPDPASPWHTGLVGTLSQVDAIFKREGARLVGEVGERFDPSVHEAIALAPHPEGVSGVIVEVHRPGVVLEEGGLVRAAQVVVSR